MTGQDRVGEVVEANLAITADVALTKLLRVVMTVAHDLSAAALGTMHASK